LGRFALSRRIFAREYREYIGSRGAPEGWVCNNKDGGSMADILD
jgi:hypothetical protein